MATDSVGQVVDDLLTGKIDTPPEWATQDSTALISAMQVNVHHHAHDPNRWMRMSELFMSLEAPKEAIEALSRAHRLDPGNQDIASTYAQIRFFSNDGKLDDITRDVLARLLTQNPKHEGAQMLMAMGETRAGNHAQAKAWVMRLRSAIAAKSGDHSAALASLDEMMQTIDNQAAAQSAGIRITVSVAKDKLAQVSQGDSLFVTVRDVAGGAPYAALRLPVSEIVDGSVVVTLSDNHAMMPGRTISQAREDDVRLSVTARISKSGNATPTTGDLSANPVLIATNQNTTVITINQVVP